MGETAAWTNATGKVTATHASSVVTTIDSVCVRSAMDGISALAATTSVTVAETVSGTTETNGLAPTTAMRGSQVTTQTGASHDTMPGMNVRTTVVPERTIAMGTIAMMGAEIVDEVPEMGDQETDEKTGEIKRSGGRHVWEDRIVGKWMRETDGTMVSAQTIGAGAMERTVIGERMVGVDEGVWTSAMEDGGLMDVASAIGMIAAA